MFTTFAELMKNTAKNNAKGKSVSKRKIESLYGNNRRIQEIIADDDFGIDVKDSPKKRELIKLHDQLVNKLSRDTNKKLDSIIENLVTPTYNELNKYFDDRLLQILRLRLIIKPEIQKSIQTHTITNHKYLVMKIIWLDDKMKKNVKYSISLGRVDLIGDTLDYKIPEINNARMELELKLNELYSSTYK